MYLDRRNIRFLALALVSLVAGLGLLANEADLAAQGIFIQLPALLLVVNGLVVGWWHTKRAVSVFEVQTARAVQRVLRAAAGRMG